MGVGVDPIAPETVAYKPQARLKVRLMIECVVEVYVRLIAFFDGNFEIGVAFAILLRQSNLNPEIRRPISINALSRSLNRPFETVRRHCNALIALGLIKREADGLVLAPGALDKPEVRALIAALANFGVRMIEDLDRLGIALPAQPEEPRIARDAIALLTLDLAIIMVEFGITPHENWMSGLIYGTVMAASAQHFTHDPELSHLYAESTTPPPEGVRQQVSAAAIARALGLSYPTVRRYIESLVEHGRLERRPSGFIISVDFMQTHESLTISDRLSQQMSKFLREVQLTGFPFGDIPTAYDGSRPPHMRYG